MSYFFLQPSIQKKKALASSPFDYLQLSAFLLQKFLILID